MTERRRPRAGAAAGGGTAGAGGYRLTFDVGGYFSASAARVVLFEDRAIDFIVRDAAAHYHVPLLRESVRLFHVPRELSTVNYATSVRVAESVCPVDPRVRRDPLGRDSTYYFTWLDGQMRRLEAKGDGKAAVWMVHSGGFYTVVKQKTLGVPPGEVHWFRYEALITFSAASRCSPLVYYHGGLMVDPIDPKVTPIVRRR